MHKSLITKIFGLLLVVGLLFAAAPTQQALAQTGTTIQVGVLDPSWTAPGGGGVWSQYLGPNDNDVPVSPGLTAAFDGREAGIIKAGQELGTYWDEGLFAFKPNLTIDALMTSLSFDVNTAAGVNPVWMTIEIDTGVVGVRTDNTVYQHVPTSNPSGWHTVDTTAGLWQKWNDNAGDTTGNPLITSAELVANNIGLNVVRAYLRLGQGDSYYNGGTGTIGWVDKVVIGTVTYDFVVIPTATCTTDCYVNSTTGADTFPGTADFPFATIQKGINTVSDGGTIHVANGTYVESLNIYKSLSLIGESEVGVIIDAHTFDDYGMDVYGDLTTVFQNFTLLGHPTGTAAYGLKISGDAAFTTIDHVTVIGSRRSGIDLNGLNGSSVSNVTIQNSAYGVGLALTNCNDIAVSNVTTSGNAWGGMALYTDSTVYTQGSSGVSLSGTNSFAEANKLYFDIAVGYPVINFTQSMFAYTVKNSDRSLSTFFAIDLDGARTFALALATPLHSSIEKISDGSHYVFPGMSIQAAVNAAAAGDVITVAAGTYVENILVNKQVSIIGAGSGTEGTIVTSPVGIDYKVGVFQITGSGVAGSPLLLQDMRIQPVGQAGVSVGRFTEATGQNVSYLSLDNIYVVGTNSNAQTEQERGLYVDLTSTLDHLTVTDSAFNNLAYGWYIQKQVSADTSTVSNVQVTNTTFNHNNLKGLYTEKLTEATFTGCTWDQNGYDATGLPSYFIPWMAGVDINLKAGSYQNLAFYNSTITNNALGGAREGVGITFKARDDGTTYGPFPASLSGVLVEGGTITGNERGIRLGEPGKNNATPTNVVIKGVALNDNEKTYTGTDGSAYGDVVNQSLAPVAANENWWGQATGPAEGQTYGDVSTCAWLDAAPQDGEPVAYPVTNAATGEGFCTIQAAIDDAETLGGHTITVAAGTYVENVVVDKSVEISGAGQANTFVIPAISNPAGGDGSLYPGASNVFLVQASDVKIHDLTVDGDNPALTSTYNVGGANLDARNGIITDHTLGLTFSNLQVYNTTVKNIYLRGIYASTTGGTFNFHHNTVTNVQAEYASIAIFAYYGPGVISNNTVSYANDAISANHSRGIQFLNNTVTHSGSGIHTDNSNSSGGVADLIQGNSVDCTDSPNAYGIWTFVPYVAPTVNNNTVTNCAIGLSAWGQGAAVTTQFTNNTVTGDLSAGSVGVYVTTDLISWGYTDVSVNFTGNTITGHETAMAFVAGEQAAWNPGPFVPKTINAVFHQNKIFGNTYEVSKDEGGLAYNADVTLNWWGSACGPTSIPAGIPYSPWYTNDAFTSTATGTTGSYTFPTGSTAASINSVIACAAPGSTLTFDGLYPGGIIVPADRTDLTFKLSNDTVITGTTEAGYCFSIYGDYTRIEAENFAYGEPKCVPAGGASGIYANFDPAANGMPADNVVTDLIIEGIEIDGTNTVQGGITLNYHVEDVQILNNYIHHCWVAVETYSPGVAGRFDIQGNMFKDNLTNIIGSSPDASHNSWGVYADPTATVVGDATYTPWTHMELFVEQVAGGTSPWANQLVSNGTMTITYAVKADMRESAGAEFVLKIPTGLSATATVGNVFDTESVFAVTGGLGYYGAQFLPSAGGSAPVTGEDVTLFTFTLTASVPGTYDLIIDETTDIYTMLPPDLVAPSTWVYLDEAHKATLLAIALPTMTTTLTDYYEIGVVQEFTVTITNPTTGGVFTDPVLVFAGLPTGTTLEYYNGSAWGTFTDVITPDLLNDGVLVVLQFRVTFTAPAGAYPITITLNDSLTTPDQFLAQTSGTATVTLLTTPVVGTLSMQGRAYRGEIPMTLTPTTLTGFTACTEESINHISDNITFVACLVGDTYVITTNQERYLDVTVYLNKTINLLTPDYIITALELKAGDADDSNKIDVSDAGIVGGSYGVGTNVRGDLNFDGKFNVQDLALVGGNYGYDTSATGTDATNPYLTWVP